MPILHPRTIETHRVERAQHSLIKPHLFKLSGSDTALTGIIVERNVEQPNSELYSAPRSPKHVIVLHSNHPATRRRRVKKSRDLICKALGAEGASVVVHYNSASSKAPAEETVKAVKTAGGDAFAFQADLRKVPEVVKLFDEAKKRYGRIDIAINTAGKVLKKPIIDTTEEEFDEMFAVNTKAAYFFMREAAKRMNEGGKIINIGTSLLAVFTGLYSVYAGAKAPLEHFTRAAAKELGISVNNIAPGPMDTPFFYPAETPDSIAYHKSASMKGKLTDIHDIVPIVKFLATDGRWITGQTIFANGGYTTR